MTDGRKVENYKCNYTISLSSNASMASSIWLLLFGFFFFHSLRIRKALMII